MSAGWFMLEHAAEIIKDRGKRYGPIKQNHERIAALWSVLLGHPVTPVQVAMCMIGVKMARLMESPEHADSAVDIAGYAACLRECQEQQDEN